MVLISVDARENDFGFTFRTVAPKSGSKERPIKAIVLIDKIWVRSADLLSFNLLLYLSKHPLLTRECPLFVTVDALQLPQPIRD